MCKRTVVKVPLEEMEPVLRAAHDAAKEKL
jgi:hypothetical protein